jgi:hypothetical protein
VWATLSSTAPAALGDRFGCLLPSAIDVTKPGTRFRLRVIGPAAARIARRLVRDAHGEGLALVELVGRRYGAPEISGIRNRIERALRPYAVDAVAVTNGIPDILAAYRRPGRCPRVAVGVVRGKKKALAEARRQQRHFGKDRVRISVVPPGSSFSGSG